MPSPFHLLGLAIACALLSLTGCRSKTRFNFEAVLSLPPGNGSASEESVTNELQERAAHLGLAAEVDPGSAGDQRLMVRLRARDKDQALAHLDALCETGRLSVRAIHDQTVYLTDVVKKDLSKLPHDHEILSFTSPIGQRSQTEELVVETAEIVNSSHVERATAEAGKKPLVHILLTANGGERMKAATEKMRKDRSRLAIIYDERIISAPVVAGELGAEITLEGFSSLENAQAVASSLNKPLSTELLIESLMPLAR